MVRFVRFRLRTSGDKPSNPVTNPRNLGLEVHVVGVDAGGAGAGGHDELADGRDGLLDIAQVPHLLLELLQDGHGGRHRGLRRPGLQA